MMTLKPELSTCSRSAKLSNTLRTPLAINCLSCLLSSSLSSPMVVRPRKSGYVSCLPDRDLKTHDTPRRWEL